MAHKMRSVSDWKSDVTKKAIRSRYKPKKGVKYLMTFQQIQAIERVKRLYLDPVRFFGYITEGPHIGCFRICGYSRILDSIELFTINQEGKEVRSLYHIIPNDNTKNHRIFFDKFKKLKCL